MLMQILSHSKTDFLVTALQNLCIFLLIDMHWTDISHTIYKVIQPCLAYSWHLENAYSL